MSASELYGLYRCSFVVEHPKRDTMSHLIMLPESPTICNRRTDGESDPPRCGWHGGRDAEESTQ